MQIKILKYDINIEMKYMYSISNKSMLWYVRKYCCTDYQGALAGLSI